MSSHLLDFRLCFLVACFTSRLATAMSMNETVAPTGDEHVTAVRSGFLAPRAGGRNLTDGKIAEGGFSTIAENLTTSASGCPAHHHRIYIVRHGERAGDGYAPLNECGWHRAEHLVKLFGKGATQFVPPEEVFAFNYKYSEWSTVAGKTKTSAQRAQQTVSHVAESLGMPVKFLVNEKLPDVHECHAPVTSFDCAQDKKAYEKLHDKIQRHQSILVGWEHMNIPFLVKFLTGEVPDKVKKWADNKFDYIVAIKYGKQADGKYHHCDTEVVHQGFDPLKIHIPDQKDFTKCPNCQPGSRRRQGCPSS